MKALFIQDQWEIRLEAKGDTHRQGDTIKCTLSAKNHAATPRMIALKLSLCIADLKKLREKSSNALTLVAEAPVSEAIEVPPSGALSREWTHPLDRNAVISDKGQSLSFLYGFEGSVQTALLTVLPHLHIERAISIFESPFQFSIKSAKSEEGTVRVKMKPPSARKLVLVEELIAGFSFKEELLCLSYEFKVKNFDTSGNEVKVKKKRVLVQQELNPSFYLLTQEHLNHEVFERTIEDALKEVSTAI